MKPSEVVEIVTMIDNMNRSRDSFVEKMVADGRLKGLGELWRHELAPMDAEIAMEAVVALYTSASSLERPRPVTPKDFYDAVSNIQKRRRLATPALPEAEFVRKTPAWVKGKILAMSENDTRVWFEQKAGYDSLQRDHPETRTYVWGEQQQVPEPEREKYMERAASMTANEFDEVYEEVFGSPVDPRYP